jgi:hypothetical protein
MFGQGRRTAGRQGSVAEADQSDGVKRRFELVEFGSVPF